MASTAPQGEIASIVIWIVGICLLVTTPFILLFIQFSLELTKTKKNETSGPEVLMFKDICYYINNSEKKKTRSAQRHFRNCKTRGDMRINGSIRCGVLIYL